MGMIAPASIVIPIVPALLRYRHMAPSFRIVCWYLFLGAFTSILFNAMSFRNINNLPLSHFYTVIELIIIVQFYSRVVPGKDVTRKLRYVSLLFVIVSIVNALFLQNIFTFNTYTKSLESLVVMVLAIIYFMRTLDTESFGKHDGRALNFINSGFLLYFSGSFIWFTIVNLTVANQSLNLMMWSVHATLLMVQYIFIAVALWRVKP